MAEDTLAMFTENDAPTQVATVQYPGFDGFLGTRAPFMLDLIILAMLVIVVVLAWSIYQVRCRKNYQLHKWTQLILASILLVAVVLFEIDIRLHGWEDRASGELGGKASQVVWGSLWVHLGFAIPSVVLWPAVVVRALRRFPNPPQPNEHSRSHRFWGWIATIWMVMTAVTGWVFYYLAFC